MASRNNLNRHLRAKQQLLYRCSVPDCSVVKDEREYVETHVKAVHGAHLYNVCLDTKLIKHTYNDSLSTKEGKGEHARKNHERKVSWEGERC